MPLRRTTMVMETVKTRAVFLVASRNYAAKTDFELALVVVAWRTLRRSTRVVRRHVVAGKVAAGLGRAS